MMDEAHKVLLYHLPALQREHIVHLTANLCICWPHAATQQAGQPKREFNYNFRILWRSCLPCIAALDCEIGRTAAVSVVETAEAVYVHIEYWRALRQRAVPITRLRSVSVLGLEAQRDGTAWYTCQDQSTHHCSTCERASTPKSS